MPTVERLRHVQRLETEGKREEASVLREICLEIPSATESVPPVSASVPAENMGFDSGQLAPVVASVLVGVVSFSARVLGALVMGLVVGGADILRARNERTLSPGERETMYARQANRVVPERAGPADQPRVRTTTITETF